MFICRVLQISKILEYLDNIYQIEAKHGTMYQLTKLFCIIFYVAHYCANIFYYVAEIEIEKGEKNTWIQNLEGGESFSWNAIYIEALYYSFITMVTVGYGTLKKINTYIHKFIFEF